MKYTLLICAIFLFLVSCDKGPEKELVYIDPIQCLGNPWDIEWLEFHDYDEYPQMESGRLQIFTDYYEKQGVEMTDVRSEWILGGECAACSCPTGERFYCMVDERDVDFLLESGFYLD